MFSAMQLNIVQQQAVCWDRGPLLVVAGPGSGKTSILAARVARLLQESEENAVLALTFTRLAASDIRERLDLLLGRRADRASISTFHAFATGVLRQHGSHVGLRPDYTLVPEEADRLAILEPVAGKLEALGHMLPGDRRSLLALLDRLFAESYDGGASAPMVLDTPEWLPALFSGYCDALVAANRLDFGSLLWLSRRLLRDNPGVAKVLRASWSHICVDEFQDTNKAQYDLLRVLAPSENANLFVVGDEDQTVYQWNGASPERLQTLIRDYKATVLQLPENYRCPAEIVQLANNLIGHNKLRTAGKQPLLSRRPPTVGASSVRYMEFQNFDAEARWVANDIASRHSEASPCAVLARTGRLLEGVAAALRADGMDVYLAKKKNDFESPVVRLMLQALRVANARHDRDALRRLCVTWNVVAESSLNAEDVVAASALVGGDLLRSWSDALDVGGEGRIQELAQQLRESLLERLDFPGVVDRFLGDWFRQWKDEGDRAFEDELAIWREFHKAFVREHGKAAATLSAYLHAMDLASKVPPAPTGAVHCLTIHGSKGLEFSHVYLVGMSQEVMPSYQALKRGAESRELEEERRNCFVAITRARDSLTITWAAQYQGWSKPRSQFIKEMAGGAPITVVRPGVGVSTLE